MPKIIRNHSKQKAPEIPSKIPHDSHVLPPLPDAMMKLIDDFADYRDVSAFICHALAVSLSGQEQPNKNIITGARICSGWLQTQTAAIQESLIEVQARYVDEHNKVGTA